MAVLVNIFFLFDIRFFKCLFYCFRQFCYRWMTPMMIKGMKKDLTPDTIFDILPEMKAEYTYSKFVFVLHIFLFLLLRRQLPLLE